MGEIPRGGAVAVSSMVGVVASPATMASGTALGATLAMSTSSASASLAGVVVSMWRDADARVVHASANLAKN